MNAVIHPTTGKPMSYEQLQKDPGTKTLWEGQMAKELGRLAQGLPGTEGTNTIMFMTHNDIANIPSDRTVTYARIVVDYRPQKKRPESGANHGWRQPHPLSW